MAAPREPHREALAARLAKLVSQLVRSWFLKRGTRPAGGEWDDRSSRSTELAGNRVFHEELDTPSGMYRPSWSTPARSTAAPGSRKAPSASRVTPSGATAQTAEEPAGSRREQPADPAAHPTADSDADLAAGGQWDLWWITVRQNTRPAPHRMLEQPPVADALNRYGHIPSSSVYRAVDFTTPGIWRRR